MSNLTSRVNFWGKLKNQTIKFLERSESICCFYGYLIIFKKSVSRFNLFLTYCRSNICNYFWHAQVCLIKPIWMNWIIEMYFCTPNRLQRIKFIPLFEIFEIYSMFNHIQKLNFIPQNSLLRCCISKNPAFWLV